MRILQRPLRSQRKHFPFCASVTAEPRSAAEDTAPQTAEMTVTDTEETTETETEEPAAETEELPPETEDEDEPTDDPGVITGSSIRD